MPSPGGTGQPRAGDDSGDFNAEVVAALSHYAEVFNQGLQVGLFGGEEGFAVEGCGQGLVFGGHVSVLPTPIYGTAGCGMFAMVYVERPTGYPVA